MLRIIELEKKSEDILKEIKKKTSKLTKIYQKDPKNKKEIQNFINKIQFNINEFEYIQGERKKEEPSEIKNIITISNPLKSKSFINWLFNNKEL